MTKELQELAHGLWVVDTPLPLIVGDVGARMTVIRLSDESLLLHSPVALDDRLRAEIDALGEVKWLVGPNKVHHLFLSDHVRAYPRAALCGAPGLAEKRRDLRFDVVLDGSRPEAWRGDVECELFGGAPMMNEIVFHHPSSRTLVLTDLAFNVQPGARNEARLFHRLVGATGRFGPHRIVRLGIRDRRAAWRSVRRILAWDFDRVVVSHGAVLDSGGHAAFARAFAYLEPKHS